MVNTGKPQPKVITKKRNKMSASQKVIFYLISANSKAFWKPTGDEKLVSRSETDRKPN